MKQEILFSGRTPIEVEIPDDTPPGLRVKASVEAAIECGADLGEKCGKLIGLNPILQIGPIGSHNSTLMAFNCEKVLSGRGVFSATQTFSNPQLTRHTGITNTGAPIVPQFV